MESYLSAYFRCPEEFVNLAGKELLSSHSGYFRFGDDVTLFGRLADHAPAPRADADIFDARNDVEFKDGAVCLPFDLSEVIGNLQRELYVDEWRSGSFSFLSKPYYSIRPLLPVGIRRYLQKLY